MKVYSDKTIQKLCLILEYAIKVLNNNCLNRETKSRL
jgi:hypothetical protein